MGPCRASSLTSENLAEASSVLVRAGSARANGPENPAAGRAGPARRPAPRPAGFITDVYLLVLDWSRWAADIVKPGQMGSSRIPSLSRVTLSNPPKQV